MRCKIIVKSGFKFEKYKRLNTLPSAIIYNTLTQKPRRRRKLEMEGNIMGKNLMKNGFGSGAMMFGLGSLTEKYIPTLAKMNIEMGMFGNVQLSKLLIALGVIAIGSELFKMVR